MLCFHMSYRKYWKRNTSNELISSGNDALHAPILENLASRWMFSNKGTNSNDGRYLILTKEDFVRCMLPKHWDKLLDGLGNGVKVAFPVKTRFFSVAKLKNRRRTDTAVTTRQYRETQHPLQKTTIHCFMINIHVQFM